MWPYPKTRYDRHVGRLRLATESCPSLLEKGRITVELPPELAVNLSDRPDVGVRPNIAPIQDLDQVAMVVPKRPVTWVTSEHFGNSS